MTLQPTGMMCYRGLQKCSKLLSIQTADPRWDLQGFYCIERAHLQLDMNTGLFFGGSLSQVPLAHLICYCAQCCYLWPA